jgi:hypothetical protein
MGLFGAINLLQSIEAGTTDGAALQIILAGSASKRADIAALVNTRHVARRVSANPITIAAFGASPLALQILFEQTTPRNYSPIEAIAKVDSAMLLTSMSLGSLNAITANATAFKYFSESQYYETYILNTLATLVGFDPSNYASLAVFLLDPTPFGQVVLSTKGMTALVASASAMTVVTSNSVPMQDIATDTNAMTITANSDTSMHLIAQSPTALAEVTPAARAIVVSIPSALIILSSYHDAWQTVLDGSTTLDDNIYPLLLNLNGLASSDFANVDAIFANAAASATIANSHPSIQAIVAEANKTKYPGTDGVMDKIIGSANLGTLLGSAEAVAHIALDEPIMTTLIGNVAAFPILLESSDAKSAIFSNSTLVGIMLTAGSTSLATVQGLAVSKTVANDTIIGTFQSLGVPEKVIILTGVLGSIVATPTNCSFDGDNEPVFTIGLTGTSLSSGPKDINKPYTNAVLDVNAIAATAAAALTFTFVDFT